MKKLFLFFVLFFTLFISDFTISQGSWFWLNPTPTRSGLNDLVFTDSLTGYSVGINGTVIKTTNGGYNWNCFNYYKSIYLNSAYFFNNNTGFILSDEHDFPYQYSEIIKTSDGGLNWNVIYTYNSYKLNKIYFADHNLGFAISGENYSKNNFILRTSNGGLNWTTIPLPLAFEMFCISFYNNLQGVIAGSGGTIAKTTDGGISWVQIKTGGEQYNDILFKGQDTIIAVGNDGVFRKSINGGVNWQNVPIYPIKHLFKIKFLNKSVGYIAGGNVFKTVDGGLNWDSISSDIKAVNISFVKNNLFYCLGTKKIGGSIYDTAGLLYRSSDTCKTWNNIHSYAASSDLNSIEMLNESTGFVVGYYGKLLKTTNGTNWDSISIPTTTQLNIVKFFNSSNGIIGGNSGNLWITSNQGSNWIQYTTEHNYNISSASFPNSNTGFYCCWYYYRNISPPYTTIIKGKICKTINQGSNWTIVYEKTNSEIERIWFTDVNTGYAIGYNLGLQKTTNSGLTWFAANIPNQSNLNYDEIYFINSQTGFIIDAHSSYNCAIYKTSDAGDHWFTVDTIYYNHGTGFEAGNMHFINNSTGFISQISFPGVGRSGNLLKTTNGGLNWYSLSNSDVTSLIFGSGLSNIKFVNQNTGYVVGEYGIILKTTNGGGNFSIDIKKPEELLPKYFILYQNYPNPFNAGTLINFELRKPGNTSLKVYDILGRELVTIINAYLNYGKHQFFFDSKSYSSGIYFYKLEKEGIIQTKKMLILK
jgi:photosystem II stability/assembly factor-like uncharacterized protein